MITFWQDPVIRVGDITAERDYLDVRDVISGYMLLLEKGETSSVVNVCSGNALPISEWLHRLLALSKTPIRIEIEPGLVYSQSNPRLVGDNTRLRGLGWTPRIPIDEMLSSLLDHWRSKIRENP